MDVATAETTPPLGRVVGENLRRLRKELGLTQDEMALRAVRVGLPWTHSHIANLESGRREDLPVSELLLLSTAFDVPVTDWFEGHANSQMRLGHVVVRRYFVKQWIRDDTKRTDRPARPSLPVDPETARAAFESKAAFEAWSKAAAATTDIEYNAARRLGVSAPQVRAASLKLWRRDLSAEREARLHEPAGLDPQQRSARSGHVTRKLIEELRQELTKGSRK